MKAEGSVFYQDEYEQIYRISWFTSNALIDFTTIIETPYVWGKSRTGYKDGTSLFRHGIVTVTRQVIRPLVGGYEIIAEGVAQYEDDIKVNYKCGEVPTDNFKYHLNHILEDIIECAVTDGISWYDPFNPNVTVWPDVGLLGTEDDVNPSDTEYLLTWMDVWPNS